MGAPFDGMDPGRTGRRPLPPRARAAFAALLLPALALVPRPALANGRYPAAGLIAVDPADPSHIVARTTFGVLVTKDRDRWEWVCEGAVGFGDYEDPMVAFTADGSLLAGLFKGLSVSKDGGCDWTLAGGELTDRFASDLSVERADPSRAVLIISNSVNMGFLTQLWHSSDNGGTWTQAGVDLPDDFLGLTVDIAPSDPQRVYISGRYRGETPEGAPAYFGALERSPDRGQTWERLDIPGSDDTHLPYLSAIDPFDPEILYVRLDGDPSDALLVSKDGGESFTQVFAGEGDLLGFALSPDGATVLVGGDRDGLWRAPSSTLEFEKIGDIGVRCLTWVEGGLFACADEFLDGFTLGTSPDDGASFTPLFHLNTLCGPLACGEGTEVASICPGLWPAQRATINADACDSGAGGSGGGSSGSGPAAPVDAEGGGCGCRLGAAGPASACLALALGALALGARRLPSRRAGSQRRDRAPGA